MKVTEWPITNNQAQEPATEERIIGDWIDRQLRRDAAAREVERLRRIAAEHKLYGRLAAWAGCLSRARAIECSMRGAGK